MAIPKLKSAKEKQEKEKRTKLFMAVFVIIILGASTAAYALMESTSVEKKKYNEFTFIKAENRWKEKSMNFTTQYLPQEVENINFTGKIDFTLFDSSAYAIASGSDEQIAANEFIQAMPLKKVNLACLPNQADDAICNYLPLKTCDDAHFKNAVMIFSEADESYVRFDNYCLRVYGKGDDLIKAADKAIFMAYGIIKQ